MISPQILTAFVLFASSQLTSVLSGGQGQGVECEFGVYSVQAPDDISGDGWTPLTLCDINGNADIREQFTDAYTDNNGYIPFIAGFTPGNCCWRIWDSQNDESTAFYLEGFSGPRTYLTTTAPPSNSQVCQNNQPQSADQQYGFYNMAKNEVIAALTSGVQFKPSPLCANNNNPSIYKRCTGLRESMCVSDCAGFVGDYQSCNTCGGYVSCTQNGDLYQMACPGGLVWDDIKKACDWTSCTCA